MTSQSNSLLTATSIRRLRRYDRTIESVAFRAGCDSEIVVGGPLRWSRKNGTLSRQPVKPGSVLKGLRYDRPGPGACASSSVEAMRALKVCNDDGPYDSPFCGAVMHWACSPDLILRAKVGVDGFDGPSPDRNCNNPNHYSNGRRAYFNPEAVGGERPPPTTQCITQCINGGCTNAQGEGESCTRGPTSWSALFRNRLKRRRGEGGSGEHGAATVFRGDRAHLARNRTRLAPHLTTVPGWYPKPPPRKAATGSASAAAALAPPPPKLNGVIYASPPPPPPTSLVDAALRWAGFRRDW